MKDNRLGSIALILGALSGTVTMILHPTGGPHHVTPDQFNALTNLMIGVHALAIAGLPLLFLGALALTRRLNAPDRLSIAALVVYGFALVAVMIAPTVSGFVGTSILREIAIPGPNSEQWHLFMDYNARINQAFAAVFTNASCTAIILWSVAMVKNRSLSFGLGIYGLVLGPAFILVIGSGRLRLDVHGAGLIMFAQAIWFIIAAVMLWRSKTGQDPAASSSKDLPPDFSR